MGMLTHLKLSHHLHGLAEWDKLLSSGRTSEKKDVCAVT